MRLQLFALLLATPCAAHISMSGLTSTIPLGNKRRATIRAKKLRGRSLSARSWSACGVRAQITDSSEKTVSLAAQSCHWDGSSKKLSLPCVTRITNDEWSACTPAASYDARRNTFLLPHCTRITHPKGALLAGRALYRAGTKELILSGGVKSVIEE